MLRRQMKKLIIGMILCLNLNIFAMQVPVRAYDPEKTLQFKSHLNLYKAFEGFSSQDEVKQLLLEGADPNTKGDCGYVKGVTLLDVLAFSGADILRRKKEEDLVALLLYHGADIQDQNRFCNFCQVGSYTTILMCILFGAKVTGGNRAGVSPLGCAVGFDRFDVVKLLLEKGCIFGYHGG